MFVKVLCSVISNKLEISSLQAVRDQLRPPAKCAGRGRDGGRGRAAADDTQRVQQGAGRRQHAGDEETVHEPTHLVTTLVTLLLPHQIWTCNIQNRMYYCSSPRFHT